MMKTIKLSELFDVERGVRLTKADQEPGDIPLVTAGEDNYGINGYISNGKSKLFKNAITVDMFCHAVYRDYEFYCDDNIIVLTPKNEMKLNELLYYSLCICQNKYKFGYGRQLRLSRLDEIKLPVEIPDWVYEVEEPDLSKYKEPFNNSPTPELNTDNWQEFKYTDIFDTIIIGKSIDLNKLEEGDINYVGRTEENNGITAKVSKYNNQEPYEGNCITVPMVGNALKSTYQNSPFYVSQNILILRNRNLNKYNAMFFNAIIRMDEFRFCYGRTLSIDRFKQLTIKLPATPKGEPDYQFMEDYIKTLLHSAVLNIHNTIDEVILGDDNENS